MIRYVEGNILDDDAEALVNPVNCVGVVGAGLAKQFKERFPWYFREYQRDCRDGHVTIGRMHLTSNHPGPPLWIISFPTKRDWRELTDIKWVQHGLFDLWCCMREHPVKSLAIPMIGCGLGGLDWSRVRPMVVAALRDLDCDIRVYGPSS